MCCIDQLNPTTRSSHSVVKQAVVQQDGQIGPANPKRQRADLAKKSDAGRVSEARAAIAEIVDRIEYQEGADAFTMRYRIGGVNLASPRGSVTIPTIVACTLAKVA